MKDVIAVVFAGGIGSRMKLGSAPKQFLHIDEKPVLVHTLEKFQFHPKITGIVVATNADWRSLTEKLVDDYNLFKVTDIVDGGETGQISRHNALKAAEIRVSDPSQAIALLHDGVRPLITQELITANIQMTQDFGNAITCTKFNETIAVSENETITEIIPRDFIYAAQAPQTFILSEILEIYQAAEDQSEYDSIDSCSLMKASGKEIFRLAGPRSNVKITTVEDFYICQSFFEMESSVDGDLQ